MMKRFLIGLLTAALITFQVAPASAIILGYSRLGTYIANAVTFDGSNDYLTRGAGLTGASDSKLLTLSFWIKTNSDGSGYRIFAGSTTVGGTTLRINILKASSDFIDCDIKNSSGTTILRVSTSTNSIKVANGWQHVMGSFDLTDTGKRFLYVDDSSDLSVTTYTNDSMDFTVADWAFGASPDGSAKMSADVADVYFAPGQYIDLSVTANRRKFIDASGKPVALGGTGATPTGTAPLIFFGNPTATWETNKGTGGGFTENGALATAGSSPSD